MKIQTPIFSVVIPTYNRADLVIEAIQSVLDQKYSLFECIVVDDGSTDDTEQKVAQFNDARLKYHYKNNGGECDARNYGISEAIGDYICFLDSDDLYLPHHLSTFARAIEINGQVIGVFRTGFIHKYSNHEVSSPFYQSNGQFASPVHYFLRNTCGVHTVAIHRDCFKDDQFDIAFYLFGDTHLLTRIFAKFPFLQIEDHTCIIREHSSRISNSVANTKYREHADHNVSAIQDLFDKYGATFQQSVSDIMLNFLKSEKYLHHAYEALLSRNITAAVSLLHSSINEGGLRWFKWAYTKFVLKIPLKIIFNIPQKKI